MQCTPTHIHNYSTNAASSDDICHRSTVTGQRLLIMAKTWSVTLNNGVVIPALGLGTLQSTPGDVGKAVDIAIRAGYRHIDGAYMYQNEKEIGDALQNLYKEGVVKREDVFITSKLSLFHMDSKEDVAECCEAVLKSLQSDYVDLFLIHNPFGVRKGCNFLQLQKEDIQPYNEATIASLWEEMEALVAKGKAKSIGISNFTITKTENLLKTAKIVPVVNQVECHAYLQQPKLRAYLKSKGIEVQAYAPVGSPSRFAAVTDSNDPVLLEDPVINEIATKHKATPAQVCISFLLHIGLIPLPKSCNESRIIENFKATELSLSKEEIKRLEGLDRNLRLIKAANFYLTTEEELWDVEKDNAYQL